MTEVYAIFNFAYKETYLWEQQNSQRQNVYLALICV